VARKKKPEEHENHERWLVSYADFITLLFAFFVVLYAISQVDLKKLSVAAKSFGNSFNGSADAAGGEAEASRKVEADAWRYAPIFQTMVSGGDLPEPRAMREAKERLQNLLQAEHLDTGVKLSLDSRGLVVKMDRGAVFLEGDASLSPSGTKLLSRLAAIVRALDSPVIVTGHAAPAAGHDLGTAFERSSARAAAIVRFLERDQRFAPGKVFLCADGEVPVPGKRSQARADGELELVVVRASSPVEAPR
jgi:chemotaxis protein MotB